MTWAVSQNETRIRNFDKYKDAIKYLSLNNGIKDGLFVNGFMIEPAKIEVKIIDDSGEVVTVEFDTKREAQAWIKNATKIINKNMN